MLDRSLITPLSAPGSLAAAPLDRVKEQLGIDQTDTTEDPALERLILAVSREIAGWHGLRRPYWRQDWKEDLAGFGGLLLLLARWPIESVASVTVGSESPEVVDAASYSIAEPDRRSLYRRDGWACHRSALPGWQSSGGDPLEYASTYTAGWLMPEEVRTWEATMAVAAGEWVRATAPNLFLFQAGGAGTTGATEPAWPGLVGGTIGDNGIIWTARRASRLPEPVEEAAILTAVDWHRGGLEAIPRGIQEEQHGPTRVSYDFIGLREAGVNPFPPAARALLAVYR